MRRSDSTGRGRNGQRMLSEVAAREILMTSKGATVGGRQKVSELVAKRSLSGQRRQELGRNEHWRHWGPVPSNFSVTGDGP